MKKILLLITLLLLCGCQKQENEKEKNIPKIEYKINEIEYGTEIKISDIVDIQNGKIKEDKYIDTYKLGNQKIIIEYLDETTKKNKTTISIDIVDKTKPLLLHRTKYTYKIGAENNLLDTVICGDNYDSNLECKIEGEYDFNKLGEYDLYFTAIDINGNETKSPFKLIITDEESKSSYTPKNVDISEFINKYKNDNTEIGVDVSTWQGEIDYKKVKDSGVKFVMIRIGYSTTTEKIIIDNKYEMNIKNAKDAGLDVGIYFYSKASSIERAVEEANWVTSTLEGKKLELPIAFDWECWSDFNSFKISYTTLNQIADSFINKVEEKGYKGMNYGSASYLEKVWNTTKHPTWLAHYTEKTDYEKEYYIWQQNASGKVPGIEGNVDLNVLYK